MDNEENKTKKGKQAMAIIWVIGILTIILVLSIVYSLRLKKTNETEAMLSNETIKASDTTAQHTVVAETELQNFITNPNNYIHPEQSEDNKDRAIGTDGKAVNLDLWLIHITDEKNGEIALYNHDENEEDRPAYDNKQLENGKIKGTVPQYIYVESNEKVYTVTGLISTFVGLDMKEAPVIPTTVTNMYKAFNSCAELTQAPTIPNGVTDMVDTFGGCVSLIQAPIIPDSVKNMFITFGSCTNLTQAPTIPDSVTNMQNTFLSCRSLTQAPTIPKSVTNMDGTFLYCTSLDGNVRINSKNVNNIDYCFGGVNNNITVQVPANSTTYTSLKKNMVSSNIKIETFQ